MSVTNLTYALESAAKEFRSASVELDQMRMGGVPVDLSIGHTYVGTKLDESETADLNALALAYLERRLQLARERLIELGMKPVALEPKE